jgi:putative membrane protein
MKEKKGSFMKKLTRITIVSFVAITLVAPNLLPAAEKENRGQLSSGDFKFVSAAAQGGLMEVQVGELARIQGSDPQIKQFGERMVTDHTKINTELKTLASQKGATLPTELSNKEKRALERLQKLSGKEFDKAYIDSMVEDHEKDLKEFQKVSQTADDADLKAFATKTAVVVGQHLDQAKQVQTHLKISTSASR